MNFFDSSLVLSTVTVAECKESLKMSKGASSRDLMMSGSGRRMGMPLGKISFKLGKKILGKWYDLISRVEVPLLTQ